MMKLWTVDKGWRIHLVYGCLMAALFVTFSCIAQKAQPQGTATPAQTPVTSQPKLAPTEATPSPMHRIETIAPEAPTKDTPARVQGDSELKVAATPASAEIAPRADRVPPSNFNDAHFVTMNELILELLAEMPKGGGYDKSPDGISIEKLSSAIRIESNHLVIEAEKAKPSFCSSATYLVFVAVFNRLNREGRLALAPEVMEKLLVRGQRDGVGVWGRWNANGPGTARLFEELHLGKNFASLDEAQPGDFMKIFWNENIGSNELGHSVIYLGRGGTDDNGPEVVRYWSSNKPNGFGTGEVPLSKIKRALFSRLEDPRAIMGVLKMPEKDSYLAAMLKRTSTPEEMMRMVGITQAAKPAPTTSLRTSERSKPDMDINSQKGRDQPGTGSAAENPCTATQERSPNTTDSNVTPIPKKQKPAGENPNPPKDDR
jgi:hypothetical protein